MNTVAEDYIHNKKLLMLCYFNFSISFIPKSLKVKFRNQYRSYAFKINCTFFAMFNCALLPSQV